MSSTPTSAVLAPAFARCRVASLEASEEYVYRFRLDPLPSPEPPEPGDVASGRIEVSLPLDGTQHVSGDFVADIRRQRSGVATLEQLRLGHLLLWDTAWADFRGEVVVNRDQGSVVLGLDRKKDTAELSRLAANGETVVFQQVYEPRLPAIFPINVRVSLADEEARPSDSPSPENVKWMAGENFRRELAVTFAFRIHLPRSADQRVPTPELTGFELSWPTLPCLSSLRLLNGAGNELPLTFDPWRNRLWSAGRVPLSVEESNPESPVQSYSGELILLVESPSELYLADELRLEGTVEVDGVLISRLGAAVSDATGAIQLTRVESMTRLTVHARMILASLLEQRKCAPAQRWLFPDVVPDQENCNAVMGRLSSRAFRMDSLRLGEGGRSEWLLLARGPEITPVDMLVRVSGIRNEVTVEVVLPNGERILSKRHTGTTEIEVRAWPKAVAEADPGMRVRMNEILAEIHRDLRNTLIPRQTQ